jgi:hypothetical protein
MSAKMLAARCNATKPIRNLGRVRHLDLIQQLQWMGRVRQIAHRCDGSLA